MRSGARDSHLLETNVHATILFLLLRGTTKPVASSGCSTSLRRKPRNTAADEPQRISDVTREAFSSMPARSAVACGGGAASTIASAGIVPEDVETSQASPLRAMRSARVLVRTSSDLASVSGKSDIPDRNERNALPAPGDGFPFAFFGAWLLRDARMARISEPYFFSCSTNCGNAARIESFCASPAKIPPRSGAARRSVASRPSLRSTKSPIDSSSPSPHSLRGTSGSRPMRAFPSSEKRGVVTMGVMRVGTPSTTPSGIGWRREFHATYTRLYSGRVPMSRLRALLRARARSPRASS